MSRFDEGKVKRIELGDGDWIELTEVVSFEMAQRIGKSEGSIGTLKEVIKKWNLKNSKGEDMPISVETLNKLDINTFMIIDRAIDKLISIPKAQPPTSGEK